MMKTLLCTVAVGVLLASTPAFAQAADRREVVEAFLDSVRQNSQLTDDARTEITAAVQQAAAQAATANEAVTAGLSKLSPEFAAAVQALGNGQPAETLEQLAPLAEEENPFLAAEARFFMARALIQQEKYEEAIPRLVELIDRRASDTLRIGEAWFLRGKSEAEMLDRDAARFSLERFLTEHTDAPRRMQKEAEAILIDVDEAEFSLLNDIHQKMDFSRRRLTLEDSGDKTQAVQDEVVALLTEMIDELEKKSGNCKGCKKSCNKPGSGGGMGGGSPGQSSGVSEQARITERDGPRTPWVDLSRRQEDPTAFNAAKTRFPLQYKDLVEQYYRSFQEQEAP